MMKNPSSPRLSLSCPGLMLAVLLCFLAPLPLTAATPDYAERKSTSVPQDGRLAARVDSVHDGEPRRTGDKSMSAAPDPVEGKRPSPENWPWQYADWLAALRVEALAEGISPATFDAALAGVAPLPEVLASDRNQPELKLGLESYLGRLLTDRRVLTGRERLQRLNPLLVEIQSRYGVEPRFLVALWGAESDYGRITGNLPVVAALVTLAYDPRRAAYFRQELLAALHLLEEYRVAMDDFRGSWAGAVGGLQFMPSVFHRYAVDFDGDGVVDIWREPGDLLASGAAYLAASGWLPGQGWGCEVRLSRPVEPELLGHGRRLSLAQWREQGVRTLDGRELTGPELEASLIIPDDVSGRAFLVYENFRVLRKWNRSDLYALAVSILADRLGEGQ